MADRCRSCGADVLWTVLPTTKRMPVNAKPHPDGTVRVDRAHRTVSGAHPAQVLGPLEVEIADGPLYLSHFASCPQADEWRDR